MKRGDVHPAIAAAGVHVAVAAIHPFADGNGVIRSVILASLAMFRGGFQRPEFTSLEEWWGRHLGDYYDLFSCLGDSFDPGADVTAFVAGHVEAQLHQVRALDVTLKVQGQIWTAVERLAEDAGLHPRLANAFWEVFFGRELTAGYYRPLADVSAATATSDLLAGVASGNRRPPWARGVVVGTWRGLDCTNGSARCSRSTRATRVTPGIRIIHGLTQRTTDPA